MLSPSCLLNLLHTPPLYERVLQHLFFEGLVVTYFSEENQPYYTFPCFYKIIFPYIVVGAFDGGIFSALGTAG